MLRSLTLVLATCDGAIDLGRGLDIVLPGLTAALTPQARCAHPREQRIPARNDLDRARVVQPGDGPEIDVAVGGALIQLSRLARRQPGNDLQGGPCLACRGVCRARWIGRRLMARKTALGVPARTRVCGSAAVDPGRPDGRR